MHTSEVLLRAPTGTVLSIRTQNAINVIHKAIRDALITFADE